MSRLYLLNSTVIGQHKNILSICFVHGDFIFDNQAYNTFVHMLVFNSSEEICGGKSI